MNGHQRHSAISIDESSHLILLAMGNGWELGFAASGEGEGEREREAGE